MSYTVYKNSSPNADPIIVPDVSGNNYSTSLSLIGKNAPGFGQQLAENFVHLLENFASSVPPSNAIEGQLWYDNANQQLKITSGGALWAPVNGVHQQSTSPVNVNVGDIWVDTTLMQLKVWNGTSFVLPSFVPTTSTQISNTVKNGPYVESLLDSVSTVTSDVVINYIDDVPISVVSGNNFTPVNVLNNFPSSLSKGITLANSAILNGTAKIANNLQTSISGPVLGDNFLRKDIAQKTSNTFSIGVDSSALQIGSNSTFILQRSGESGYTANFLNSYSSTGANTSGRFTFDVQRAGQTKTLLTIDGSNQRTSITGDLHVSGALDFLPAGTIISYAGNTIPKGWLLCNGATTSTLVRSSLFSVIGTTYGSTTSTNFCVPNIPSINTSNGPSAYYIIRT